MATIKTQPQRLLLNIIKTQTASRETEVNIASSTHIFAAPVLRAHTQ
jgi:hypothetical protein